MSAEQTALTVLFIYAIISSLVVIYVCRDARKRIGESRVCSHELPKIEEIAFSEEVYRTLKEQENGRWFRIFFNRRRRNVSGLYSNRQRIGMDKNRRNRKEELKCQK